MNYDLIAQLGQERDQKLSQSCLWTRNGTTTRKNPDLTSTPRRDDNWCALGSHLP